MCFPWDGTVSLSNAGMCRGYVKSCFLTISARCVFWALLYVIAVNRSDGGAAHPGVGYRGVHVDRGQGGCRARGKCAGTRRGRLENALQARDRGRGGRASRKGEQGGGHARAGMSGRMRQPVARLLYRWRDGRRKDRGCEKAGPPARLPGYAPARRARGRRSSASNPPPWRLARVMSPPCWRAMLRAMDRPRPLPPVWRLRECSTRKNGSNTVST